MCSPWFTGPQSCEPEGLCPHHARALRSLCPSAFACRRLHPGLHFVFAGLVAPAARRTRRSRRPRLPLVPPAARVVRSRHQPLTRLGLQLLAVGIPVEAFELANLVQVHDLRP